MKRTFVLAVSLLALSWAVPAQDEAEAGYVKLMKETGATMGSLRKNLEAKAGPAAAADAKKLQGIFGQVHDFWTNKKVDDAVVTSKEASTAFGDIAQLASDGKFDEGVAALKTASGTCATCHQAHRVKAEDGSWKFKY